MPFANGYERQEALDMLALCANAEMAALAPIPNPPEGWAIFYDSPPMGPFENKWQLWKRVADERFAIVLRGTVEQVGSVFEDLIALMIKAEGSINAGSASYPYKFAEDPEAGVHYGFALGTLILLHDPNHGILAWLKKNNVRADSEIYITGHSQGAAMATLLRSYLKYNDGPLASCAFKTYVFAQPKPGNDHYADDFELSFCPSPDKLLAFRVTNPFDWVPQVAFTIQLPQDIDKPNPLSAGITGPLMQAIASSLDAIRAMVAAHTSTHFQSSIATLAQMAPTAPAVSSGSLNSSLPVSYSAPFMPSLNYVNAGSEILLTTKPCTDAQMQDAFYQHHAVTYYPLVDAYEKPA